MKDEAARCCQFSTVACGVCRLPVTPQQAWLWTNQLVAGESITSQTESAEQVDHLGAGTDTPQHRPQASWTISHERCTPDGSGIFDVRLPRDHRAFLEFAANVMTTPWARGTDLDDLMREAAAGTERFAAARPSPAPTT